MKKIILSIMAIAICFLLVGCGNNNLKTVEGNKAFGKYTGIYKLEKAEFKIIQYKDTLSVVMNNKGESMGNSTVFIEDNKVEVNDYKLEFKGNTVIVSSKNDNMPNGVYKRVNSYSTKAMYKDNIGDASLFETSNGVYKNDVSTIYAVKTDYDTYRFANSYKDTGLNLIATKEDDKYVSDLFDEKYELTVNNDTLDLRVISETTASKELAGKYTKKGSIKMSDAIKLFIFDSYAEQQ